ncbi:tRNA (adenosine(37)-N6)-threonylcarbamoyltransferase complex transferase subunit TsaD [Patescibacteria group bacterium]|nr:tRNA (adenosine(37)-N6)-threonylcarbamoyltransferase complex transferase subunit TsaD [Patescibacteria group bacterium]MBU1682884.1 tRNA (adenosine(37)-N6)-threonylcarbamoyltransferase complex transferase subunit TsaD [Patescibacteria group bacterium]MBU1934695.1 tRNA (adenosine(37)-N6)-threonylcarbamoyltransferase complex transferase subunit TsaD [Patescibacteria group bacterium]
MRILGIETSCDETAAAVVENGTKVLSNVIASSVDLHAQTGGVVPEVAAREHIRQISPVIDKALSDANVDWSDIDAIAVTHAPGLLTSLLVGVNTAQSLAYIHKKPLIPIHHIAAHIYANFLERDEKEIDFPVLILTISGGHNELVLMKGHYDFEVIGETLDDAAGEAFDKIARLLDLGFPGGPIISERAEKGSPDSFNFPRPMLDKENKYNFSFSGLKSAVKREVDKLTENNTPEGANGHSRLRGGMINNISASFQSAVIDVLTEKLVMAADEFDIKAVHLAGGVSANQLLRKTVREKLPKEIPLLWPVKNVYCTDNAAMVAAAAYFCPQKNRGWEKVEVHSQLPLSS